MDRVLIRSMGYGDGGDTEDNETRESAESDAMVFAICFEIDRGDGRDNSIQELFLSFLFLFLFL